MEAWGSESLYAYVRCRNLPVYAEATLPVDKRRQLHWANTITSIKRKINNPSCSRTKQCLQLSQAHDPTDRPDKNNRHNTMQAQTPIPNTKTPLSGAWCPTAREIEQPAGLPFFLPIASDLVSRHSGSCHDPATTDTTRHLNLSRG